jgi:hypothetical protein
VTVADLAEQFSLALKIRDDLTQSNEIVIRFANSSGRWTTASSRTAMPR